MRPTFASASVVALAALVASAALASQNPPDFSGSWVLNRARSAGAAKDRLAAPPEGEPQNLVLDIEQTATQVTIVRRGGAADPIVLVFDGSEVRSKGPRGGVATSRSRWQGRVLLTETRREVTGPSGVYAVTTRDERSLSEDGRTLTLKSVSATPRGEVTRTLVFDRRDPPSP
jgi:hypothetical protein